MTMSETNKERCRRITRDVFGRLFREMRLDPADLDEPILVAFADELEAELFDALGDLSDADMSAILRTEAIKQAPAEYRGRLVS
jgi:hypothetical protein